MPGDQSPDASIWRSLRSLLMAEREIDPARDLGSLVVPAAGALAETGDPWELYYLKPNTPLGSLGSVDRPSIGHYAHSS